MLKKIAMTKYKTTEIVAIIKPVIHPTLLWFLKEIKSVLLKVIALTGLADGKPIAQLLPR